MVSTTPVMSMGPNHFEVAHIVFSPRTCQVCRYLAWAVLYVYFLAKTACPRRSISLPSAVPVPAASSNRCQASESLTLRASAAALTRIPHFSYMAMAAPGSRFVHLGTNMEARRGLPACKVRL